MKAIMRLSWAITAITALLFVNSCKKDNNDPFSDNLYLLSAERAATFTQDNVETLMNTAKVMYPEISQITGDVASGVEVYRVTYNTTFKGESVIASGLIVIPDVIGDYPVLSFQNGTNTLYSEAPSVNPFSTLYQMLECVSSMGYIVVIPDYIGFGSSESIFHPYLHKESTVTAVLDLLRAAGEFDEDIAKNITFLDEYYLLGYSQGGWATLSLLEAIDNSDQDEFNVAACACGAGPYDIDYFNTYILGLTEYPMPSFLGYIAKAYDDHDLFTNTLTDLFKQPYASNIETYFDGLHSTGQINDHLTTVIADLFTSDYITGFASSAAYQSIRDAMAENSIDAWDTSVPLLFVHGDADTYVPKVISDNMVSAMTSASSTSGSNLEYVTLAGKDHSGAIVPACIESLKFFKAIKE